jgi:hypothetical protein
MCPQCRQIDAVRKVSSIVSEGTSSTQHLGIAPNLTGADFYLVGMQGSSMTDLAQRLAPPARRPGGIGARVFLAAITTLLGSIMACGLSVFTVTPEFGRFACGNWVLGIALVTAILAFLPLAGIGGIRRKQAAYDRMIDLARSRWDHLYYGGRDDITFNPEHQVVIPIHNLGRYLYAEAGA